MTLRFLGFMLIFALVAGELQETWLCNICVGAIELFKSALRSDWITQIYLKFETQQCLKSHTEHFCRGAAEHYKGLLYKGSMSMFNSHEICTAVHMCHKYQYVENKLKNFTTFLRDAPPTILREPRATTRKSIKFLVVTDVHTDIDYEEGRPVKCTEDICCRKSTLPPSGEYTRAGKFGHIGRCDIPLRTVESFLEYSVEKVSPDFILYLGDSPAHNMWEQTKQVHFNALKNVTHYFLQHYKGLVYPILGNHEGFPLDNFDPNDKERHGWILEDSAKEWKKWLTEDSYNTYLKLGSYSQLHPGTRLRIIALNNLVSLSRNVYLFGNQTDPLGVLKWLHKELDQSERAGEAVLLMDHTPPFHPPFNPYYAERFVALLERYANIIVGQMYGHTHEDHFVLMKGKNGRPFSVAHVNPSLTTFTYRGISFRVYEMDSQTYELLDHETYRLDLEKSNKEGKAFWVKSYRFTDYYKLPSLSINSYEKLSHQITVDPAVWRKVLKMRFQEGPTGETIFKNPSLWPKYFCDYNSSTISQVSQCRNLSAPGEMVCMSYGFNRVKVCRRWEYLIPYSD